MSSLLMLFSCENDLDLTAEYDEVIIVYGLLDHNQDTQFVKINKSFLGDGNALDYAQEPDSFIYENVYATLTDLSDESVMVLQPYSAPKDPGIFSDEKNIVYFTDQAIKGGVKYRLDVTNKNSGESARATTLVIDTVRMSGNLGIPRAQVSLFVPSGYIPLSVAYEVGRNTFRFESTLFFNYIEYPKSNPTDTVHKRVEFDLGHLLASDALEGRVIFRMDGESFFKRLAEEIPHNPALEREIVDMEFLIRAATKELQLYIEANGDLDGIAQVRPEFSNIENGYGLFSSKYNHSAHRLFSLATIGELREGIYTSNLGFVNKR